METETMIMTENPMNDPMCADEVIQDADGHLSQEELDFLQQWARQVFCKGIERWEDKRNFRK